MVAVSAVLCALAVLAWLLPIEGIAVARSTGGQLGLARVLASDLDEAARALGLEVDVTPLARARLLVLVAGASWAVVAFAAQGPAGALMPAVFTLAGWKLCRSYVNLLEKKRREDIAREFPLMVSLVRVYAKSSDLIRALDTVRNVLRGELRKQVDLLVEEMKVYSLPDALRRFARRCRYGPVDSFVSVVLFGISTGADVDAMLATFARRAYEARVNEVKRRVKAQPVFMSFLPVALGLLLVLVFVFPLFADIIGKLRF